MNSQSSNCEGVTAVNRPTWGHPRVGMVRVCFFMFYFALSSGLARNYKDAISGCDGVLVASLIAWPRQYRDLYRGVGS